MFLFLSADKKRSFLKFLSTERDGDHCKCCSKRLFDNVAVLKAAFGDTPIMIEYDDFIKNLGHFLKKKKSHPTILLSCALSLNSELHAVTLIEGCVQGA